MLDKLKKDLRKFGDKTKAEFYPHFFKTGAGEYGEGDQFLGITAPLCRLIAKKYKDISLEEIKLLLSSGIHEERLVSLFILVEKFRKADTKEKENIYKFYLKNTKKINNWDLVDLSSHKIMGQFIYENPEYTTKYNGVNLKGRKIFNALAHSQNLWEKRISIISNFVDIKYKNYETAIEVAETLLNDRHDLIHKAVGWVLREIGNNDRGVEDKFLKKHYKKMPRTMLRYAIEKYPEEIRQKYLKNEI